MSCPSCGVENPTRAVFCMSCGTPLVVSGMQSSSSQGELSSPVRFVGRKREMQELRSALADAISGHGRLVMVAGEPGIGKTRIAQELSAYAEKSGVQVLCGWCSEQAGAPPYWPWILSLRGYIQQRDAEALRVEMGAGAVNIAETIHEVHVKFPDLKTPPTLDRPEQARFRLFDSMTTFLKNAAQSHPIVLILDDLHWCDEPSLLLLQFLARQLGESRLLV
jgi:predicted ATPase